MRGIIKGGVLFLLFWAGIINRGRKIKLNYGKRIEDNTRSSCLSLDVYCYSNCELLVNSGMLFS